jgi:death on curing protein
MILPDARTLRIFHDAQLRRFGGAPGMRDAGLLESAVGRVRSALLYAEMDAVEAAAMLCHAVLKNHAFVDGNKRTAYGALVMTLAGNGLRLRAGDMEIAEMIFAAAGGSEGWEAIAAWLRPRVGPDGA